MLYQALVMLIIVVMNGLFTLLVTSRLFTTTKIPK